ncbi:hypothetical protein FD755_016881 [Muntiacus reevesi]|uniref:Uncharacterized protein n=1 Tax=Muntiacus reevesi TaxID=9886 RepID=A0A5N3XHM5_MUNRE|nr:hypothetical protein FD755_016881 [Muntiacus reevesi]
MTHTSQPFFTGAHSMVPPACKMLKEPPCSTTSSNPCSTVFMNWCCLGFMAFTQSVNYAFTAKCLNICTLILGLLLIIVHIIILSTRSLMIIQAFTSS